MALLDDNKQQQKKKKSEAGKIGKKDQKMT